VKESTVAGMSYVRQKSLGQKSKLPILERWVNFHGYRRRCQLIKLYADKFRNPVFQEV